jgi:positive regulator of sigma E activity
MIFALILLLVVALAFFVSPLIAVVLFVVGAIAFIMLFSMRRNSEAGDTTSSTPGSHAAERFRREARKSDNRLP